MTISFPLTHRGELFNEFVRGPKGCQADLLRKLGEGRIGEERRVSQQLVADVGLRGVERFAAVTDILR